MQNGRIKIRKTIIIFATIIAVLTNSLLTFAETINRVIYHHTDYLSGTSIDTDETGNIVEATDYYPFGSVWIDDKASTYDNQYKYTGKELDDESGLYYYGARYYDSVIGRFISQDMVEGQINMPQSLNRYSYVMNNPMKYTDPDGNFADTVLDAGFTIYDVVTSVKNLLETSYQGGRYIYGYATNNESLQQDSAQKWMKEGGELGTSMIDTGFDGVSMLIPFVPAGTSRLARTSKNVWKGIDKLNIKSVEEIFENPGILEGKEAKKYYEQLEKLLGKNKKWEKTGTNGNVKDGFIFREKHPKLKGKYTDRMIQWHPGGGRHGKYSYWKISSGKGGTVRIGPQF